MKCAVVITSILALTFTACTSNRQLADQAYLREDWDTAAANYTTALQDTTEPAEIAQIKPRLAESRNKAAEVHLAKAKELIAIGDITQAHAQAKRAFDLNPTPESQTILGTLRSKESQRLLAEGKAAIDHQAWDSAVESLRKAKDLGPSDEIRTMLATAEEKAQKLHHAEFDKILADARERLKHRAWAAASSRYVEAHRHGSTADSKREAEFAKLMAEAEEAATARDIFSQSRAQSNYAKAKELGIDVSYVDSQIRRVTPARYAVTIHEAVILPFKPQSKMPWDGLGGQVAGADELLKSLGGFIGPQGLAITGLCKAVLAFGSDAIAAPDCYLTVTVDNQVFGGPSTVKQDEYQPAWNLSFVCDRVTAADRRIVNIQVTDQDTSADDNVGSVQVSLGELVAVDGPRTLAFYSKEGVLQAGGLLALKISVERH